VAYSDPASYSKIQNLKTGFVRLKQFFVQSVTSFPVEEIIMAQQKINMPSGSGGLMRYFDEYKSKIRIKPGHIIIMCVVVIIIMMFLYTYGNKLLGL